MWAELQLFNGKATLQAATISSIDTDGYISKPFIAHIRDAVHAQKSAYPTPDPKEYTRKAWPEAATVIQPH
jgi:hypothetical protein